MTTDSPEVVERIRVGLDLVDVIARSVRKQMGHFLEVEELKSHGHEALLMAARTWEAERGVPFRCWASLRIRGALMESYRSRGPLPKRVYRKLRAMQAADRVLEIVSEEQTATPPADDEAADERLAETLQTAATAMAIGMLRMKSTDDMLVPPQDDGESPEEQAARRELAQVIKDAIADRPENEQQLLKRHYFDDLTFEEAAAEIGLSKSWGSRLHARALEGVARALKRRRFEAP